MNLTIHWRAYELTLIEEQIKAIALLEPIVKGTAYPPNQKEIVHDAFQSKCKNQKMERTVYKGKTLTKEGHDLYL